MSELTLLVLQLSFLALMWIFVFSIVWALRSDLFGQRVRKMQTADASGQSTPPTPPRGTEAPRPPAAAAAAGAGDIATTDNAGRLVITSGAKAGSEFPLGRDEITIGRSSDSSIIIRDDYTSNHHARLMLWSNQWMIQDLDSTNGTFLNGSRVTVPAAVPLGATVKVGATTFELRR